METNKIEKIIPFTGINRRMREKRRYRRMLWKVLFLEALVDSIQEKNENDIREQPKRNVSSTVRIKLPSWSKRDTLELTFEMCVGILFSENYNAIMGRVRRAEMQRSDHVLKEAYGMMEDYYNGKMNENTIVHLFRTYCSSRIEEEETEETGRQKRQFRVLQEMYECFARANVHKAVGTNNKEGRMLVEESGLSWAGTTYYNANYFYMCENMQKKLKGICAALAGEYEIEPIDFEIADRGSRFIEDGGLSFHGVFEWLQKQNNYPPNQYGFTFKQLHPPKQFIYLYRNSCGNTEKKRMAYLKENILQMTGKKSLHSEQGNFLTAVVEDGRDYHNGRSYLLENSDNEDVSADAEAMYFLETFRLYRVSGCMELLYFIK